MAKLDFYYASMNAGKSNTLLQADFNYRERGMATMLWTAAVDDRGAAVTYGVQTEIGGNDSYIALCSRHFSPFGSNRT